MISHVSLGVSRLARSMAFYDAALAPLGYVRVWTKARGAGYGPPGTVDETFAIVEGGEQARAAGAGSHLALAARDRAAVDGFHAAAMGAGAKDEGAPGLRPHYGPGYYAAFVFDPDGHKLEAVCHEGAGEEGIERLHEDFLAAFARGDADACAACFAEDGVRVGSLGEVQRGRAEIRAGYAALLERLKGARLALSNATTRALAPDVVLWQASMEIVPPAGRPAIRGHVVEVMRREGGRWLIVEGHPKLFPPPTT